MEPATDHESVSAPKGKARAGGVRSIFGDFFAYGPARLAPALAGILATALFTRLLSPASYGDYTLLATAGSLFMMISWGWLQHSVLRYHEQWARAGSRDVFYSTIIVLMGIVTALVLALGVAIGSVLMAVQSGAWLLPIIATALFVCGRGINNVVLKLAQARYAPKRYTLYTFIYSGGALVLGALLVLVMPDSPAAILIGSAICGLLTGSLELSSVVSQIKLRLFSRELAQRVARYGLPLAIVAAASWALGVSDRYIIAFFRDSVEVGLYGAVYNFSAQSVDIFLRIIMLSAFPLVVKSWEHHGEAAARATAARYAYMFYLVAFPIVVGLIVVRKPLVGVLLPPAYTAGSLIIPWIVGGAFWQGLSEYLILPLQLRERTDLLMWYLVGAGVFNIALNFVLVPAFGALGAAYSTFVSYLVYTVVVGAIAYRRWRWNVFSLRWLIPTVSGLGMGALLILSGLDRHAPLLALVIMVPLGMVIYAALLLVLREPTLLQVLPAFLRRRA